VYACIVVGGMSVYACVCGWVGGCVDGIVYYSYRWSTHIYTHIPTHPHTCLTKSRFLGSEPSPFRQPLLFHPAAHLVSVFTQRSESEYNTRAG
jgi:hypothetical protein